MHTYVLRIKFKNCTFADVPFVADSYGQAKTQAEALYGSGSVIGCIDTK